MKDWLLDRRDRLLTDPAFQRWITRFPLTRWITRRKAKSLFDITAGFVYSQVLYACVQLQLLERLQKSPARSSALAEEFGIPEKNMLCLLRAASSLNLTSVRSGGRYGLGELGAALLGNSGISQMVLHHKALYCDLIDPVSLLKTGKGEALSAYWAYAVSGDPGTLSSEDVATYSGLMSASQNLIIDDVLRSFPMGNYQKLLDLGGGEGVFASNAVARFKNLQATVFDLPPVAKKARERVETLADASRISVSEGDFIRGPVPEGADLISLVRVLHDHDDADAQQILHHAAAASRSGGTILIAEPMAETAGAHSMGYAYFGIYLLAMGSGRPRTSLELTEMLKTAGFDSVSEVSTPRPLIVRILTAKRM